MSEERNEILEQAAAADAVTETADAVVDTAGTASEEAAAPETETPVPPEAVPPSREICTALSSQLLSRSSLL